MEYLLKFSAIIALFYLFYKVFLQKETFFQSNRIYFLIGIAAAILVPLITVYKTVDLSNLVYSEQIIQPSSANQSNSNDPINYTNFLIYLYWIGLAFFGLRFVFQLVSLSSFLRGQTKRKEGRFTMIETEDNTSPFSFFNYIIYTKKGFDKTEIEQILNHEKIHAGELHSLDTILTQLLIIFNWFNPFAWLYQKELQKNLEFIADDGAQGQIKQKESYQYLLLKTVRPQYSMALTSNFYHSLIKKRITMLHKDKSNKTMYLKFVFIIPLLIAFVFTFNTKVVAQQTKNVVKKEINKEVEVLMIDKDFQKTDLEELKSELANKGITFSYKGLKYNDNKEIIAIQISVSNKNGNEANISNSGTKPIAPISIKHGSDGSLAVGNMSEDEMDNVFIYGDANEKDHQVFVDKDGNKTVIIKKEYKGGSHENEMYFVTKDDEDGKVIKKKIVIKGDGDGTESVWVSDSGDTTNLKQIKVIEIDEDSDGEHVIVKRVKTKDGDEVKVEVIVSDDKDEHQNMHFIKEGDEPSLVIIDGKEMENFNMEDLNKEDIETIEILKGDKAVDEYGEKAKNGVMIIKTKKKS